MDGENQLHVAIIASPGMGHLIPVLLLANRLVTHHHLPTTILAVTAQTSSVETHLIRSLNAINIIQIPCPDISALLPPDAALVTQLAVMMREACPSIRSVITAMSRRPDVLIADLFANESLTIAEELQMQKYIYNPSSAWFVALTTFCPILDKHVKGQYVDQKEPLKIPGCKPVRPEDVVDPMLDRNDQQYFEYLRMGRNFSGLSDGILVNTWRGMERESLDALKHNEILRSVVKVPVYEIGPLTREIEPASSDSDRVIEWLNKQPSESVIFVSFGSGGTLPAEQLTELAWGLEQSRQRFVWVVRPPMGSTADGAYFTVGSGSTEQPDYFPDGFLTRTREVGFVIPLWGEQVKILNHPSVGGFLSHCGMNSTFESIKYGVPMIAWPLYAEQRLNATILAEEVKIAMRPAVLPMKKVVGREEIAKIVRALMEGEEGEKLRDNVKRLRESANEALSIKGSSYKRMCEFIECCQTKMKSSEKPNGK